MVDVRIRNLAVEFGRETVLTDCQVTIPDGSFTAVVGPSGSGKSTLLRAIAGLTPIEHGRVEFGGHVVSSRDPAERNVGMVFQTPVLFPHRSVRRNVSFPLELRKQTLDSIRQSVDAESRAMHIEHLLSRGPRHLSRGEQQLVQIARTMVRRPSVLLLDEPFAPLDEHLRRRMRAEIMMLQAGYGVTTLMATNDPDDVSALATDVVVLGPIDAAGEVGGQATSRAHTAVQAGSRATVFDEPVSIAAASAMGVIWRLDVRVEADHDGFWLTTPPDRGGLRYRAWSPALRSHVGASVTVAVREGDFVIDERGDLDAVIDRVVPGPANSVMCRVGNRVVSASAGDKRVDSLVRDDRIRLRIRRFLIFDPRTSARLI